MTNIKTSMIPDGTYKSAVGTLDVVGGVATLRSSTWSDYEDGRHGSVPSSKMSAAELNKFSWWKDGVGYGAEA